MFQSPGTPDASTDPTQQVVNEDQGKEKQRYENKERSSEDVLKKPDINVQWKILFETSLPNTPHFPDMPETHSDEDTKENINTNISRCPKQKCNTRFENGVEQTGDNEREATMGQSPLFAQDCSAGVIVATRHQTQKESATSADLQGVGRRKQKTPRQLQQQFPMQPQPPDSRRVAEFQRSAAGRREPPPVRDCSQNSACGSSTSRGEDVASQAAPRQFVHILARPDPQAQKVDRHPETLDAAKDLPCTPRKTPLTINRKLASSCPEEFLLSHSNSEGGASFFIPEQESQPSTCVICSSEQSVLALSTGKPKLTSSEDVDLALNDGQTLTVKLGTDLARLDSPNALTGCQISEESLSYAMAQTHTTKTKEDNCNSVNNMNAGTETSCKLKRKPYKRSTLESLLTTHDILAGNSAKKSSFVDDHPLLQSRQRVVSQMSLNVESSTNIDGCDLLQTLSLPPARSECNLKTSTTQMTQTIISQREAFDGRSISGKAADSTLGTRFSSLLQSFSKRAEDEFTSAKTREDSPCKASSAPTAVPSGEQPIATLLTLRPNIQHSNNVLANGTDSWTAMNYREEDTRLSPGVLNKSIKHVMSLKDGWVPKRLYKQRTSRNLQLTEQQHSLDPATTRMQSSLVTNIQYDQTKPAHIANEMKSEQAPNATKSVSSATKSTTLSDSSKITEKASPEQLLQNTAQLLTKAATQPCPVAPIPMVRIPYIPVPVYSAAFPGAIPALSHSHGKSSSSSSIPVMTTANQPSIQGHVQQPHYIPIVPKLPVVLPTLPTSVLLEPNGSSAYGSPLVPGGFVPEQTPTPGKQTLASAYTAISPIFPGLATPQSQTGLGQGSGVPVSQVGIVSSQIFQGSSGGIPVILFLPSFAQSMTQCRPQPEQTATGMAKTTVATTVLKRESQESSRVPEDEAPSEKEGVSNTDPKHVQSEKHEEIPSPTTGTDETGPSNQDDISTNAKDRGKTASSPAASQVDANDLARSSPLPVEEKARSPVALKSGRKRTASKRYDSHVDIDLSDASDYGDITPITSDEEWTPGKDDGQTSDDEQETGRKSHKRDEFEDLFRPPKKRQNTRSAGPGKRQRSEVPSHLKSSPILSLSADSRLKTGRSTAKHNQSDHNSRSRDQARVSTKKEHETGDDDKAQKQDTACSSHKLKASPQCIPRKRRRVPYTQDELTCKFCSKMFINIYRLRRHEFSHGNERPYVCDVCGKAFKQSGHRNEHRLTHNANKRSFLCNICGVVIASRSSFR